jgi:outer membrane protein assembly factor BamB
VTNTFENAPPARFPSLVGMVAALTLMCTPAHAQSVLQYHLSSDRAGNYVVPGLTLTRSRSMHLDGAFDGRVDGHVYAQPLQFNAAGRNLLLVTTENDTVDALDARTGRMVWQKSLGRPVTSAMLPCGNIDPLGITGTPAIEQSRQAMYLDAMVATRDGPQHLIFGLSLENGEVLSGFPVNVANALARRGLRFVSRDQNQRGALLISHNIVYVSYGGHYGDCGNYHGWVVGVGLDDPQRVLAWSTSAGGGGIWAPGGVVYDGNSLFVATGNTFEASQWDGGEAVVRLGLDLKPPESTHDYFAPSNWRMLDRRDADLGGTAPVPLDLNGSSRIERAIIALGKDGKAYLLDRDNLGGIGKELASIEVSSDEIRTAPAVYPAPDGGAFVAFPAQFIDCPAGKREGTIGALKLMAAPKPSISVAWCASLNGGGTPIVTTTDGRSNPIVWIVGAEGDNRLHAFRGDDGEAILTEPQVSMHGLRHFAPIVATTDHLFVPGDGRIYGFAP